MEADVPECNVLGIEHRKSPVRAVEPLLSGTHPGVNPPPS